MSRVNWLRTSAFLAICFGIALTIGLTRHNWGVLTVAVVALVASLVILYLRRGPTQRADEEEEISS